MCTFFFVRYKLFTNYLFNHKDILLLAEINLQFKYIFTHGFVLILKIGTIIPIVGLI